MPTDKFDKWLKARPYEPGKPSKIKREPTSYDTETEFSETEFSATNPVDMLHELLDMLIAQMSPTEERAVTGRFDMVTSETMDEGMRITLNLSSQKMTQEELEDFKKNKGDN